jgi:hypothetical protein
MKKNRVVALAAVLCAGVALPALAAWDRIGSVQFSPRNDHETTYGNFGGRVEALSLRARNAPVACNDVTATFGNGMTRSVFRGMLTPGRDVMIDLPGQSRLVRRLDFDCRALAPRQATVDIAADVGRYQAEWRRSPDWNRMWSRMFNWDNNRYADNNDRFVDNNGRYTDNNGRYTDNNGRFADNRFPNDRYVTGPLNTQGWITLGRETFQGNYDHETTITGMRGRDVTRIGLRPINDDARCSRVAATFANGMTRDLKISDGEVLREDRVFQIDLPGNRRDVTRIDLMCHPEHGGQVTMLVMADR